MIMLEPHLESTPHPDRVVFIPQPACADYVLVRLVHVADGEKILHHSIDLIAKELPFMSEVEMATSRGPEPWDP